ncbi:CTH.2 family protein [Megaselia abdita]
MQSRRQQQQQQQQLQNLGLATRVIHGGQQPEENSCQAVVTPIVTSVTFKQNEPGSQRGCINSLRCNPTRQSLEDVLSNLENCKYAVTTCSGLCAISTVVQLLKNGDQIIVGQDQSVGTNKQCKEVITRQGIQVETVDLNNAKEVEGAIKQNTRLILIETPSNPQMKITDIEQVVKIARKKQKGDGVGQRILVAVDNTIQTPVLQRPLELGADICITSLTKYMNGHNDVIMGSITTNDDEIEKRLRNLQETLGVVPSPVDCSLVERGLKTLPLRLEQIEKSALKIAKELEQNQQVEKVLHPGLNSHPQNDLNKRQCGGTTGLFSVIVKGNGDIAKRVLKNLKLIQIGEFSGGCESSACIPWVFCPSLYFFILMFDF